ncbi:AraC family transcriptional regulator [Roseateles sp. MS654]|uniref:AraC family transcriptional regulator n=1 Tax=Roseateles sp. MS654 TaxID=3412685 RepID=UPI003C2FF262
MTGELPTPPRGVLHPAVAPGRFEHRQRAPAPDLAPWIEHHWFVAWDLSGLPDRVQETLPHPNLHLVVENGEAALWGIQRRRFTKTLSGRGWVYGLKFRVAAFHAFHRQPVSDLSDRHVAACDVLGEAAQALIEPESAGDLERLSLRAEALLRSLAPGVAEPRAERIAAIVRRIADDPAITSVDALCRVVGESVRQLQRDFHRYVGVPPKWVIARYRLHEAVALIQSGAAQPDAELAQRLGYFDQAHFIRDFRRIVGCTPRDYARSLENAAATLHRSQPWSPAGR